MKSTCPSHTMLSTWLDDEVNGGESQDIRSHLEGCRACREQVLNWVQVVRDAATASHPEHDSRAPTTMPAGCLDEEMLVAYSEAELSGDDAARAEQHLSGCSRCVAEVQRLIGLRVSMGEAAIGMAAAQAEVGEPGGSVLLVGATWLVARIREFVRAIGQIFTQPWPALGAVAAAAVLTIVIARLLPTGSDVGEIQFRGVPEPRRVEVVSDSVTARARPGDDQPIVATLGRGTVGTRLEDSAEWTRIELRDGRRVWVRSAAVSALPRPLAPLGAGRREGITP